MYSMLFPRLVEGSQVMIRTAAFCCILLLGLAMGSVFLQAAPMAPTPEEDYEPLSGGEPTTTVEAGPSDLVSVWRTSALWLGAAVLLFAVFLIGAIFYAMVKSGDYWTDRSFKAFALSLIIPAGLFLIVIGFSDKQLAPMMGLLGTIAGYILGAETRGAERQNRQPQEAEPS